MAFVVTLTDDTSHVVSADSFRQEGQLLTFYSTDPVRPRIDCWSTPVAAFRTSRVEEVRRVDAVAGAA